MEIDTDTVIWCLNRHRTPRRYAARSIVRLREPATTVLRELCLTQPNVRVVSEPTPGTIGIIFEYAEIETDAQRMVLDFIRALTDYLNRPIGQQQVIVWNYQRRESKSEILTPEMAFLTDGGVHPRAEWPLATTDSPAGTGWTSLRAGIDSATPSAELTRWLAWLPNRWRKKLQDSKLFRTTTAWLNLLSYGKKPSGNDH